MQNLTGCATFDQLSKDWTVAVESGLVAIRPAPLLTGTLTGPMYNPYIQGSPQPGLDAAQRMWRAFGLTPSGGLSVSLTEQFATYRVPLTAVER